MRATAPPTGVKSNMAKPALLSLTEARKLDTIRLDGVPIKVVMPPNMVPKDNGMSMCPGGILRRCAVCRAIGMSSAKAPTLFIKAEKKAPKAVTDNTAKNCDWVLGKACSAITSTSPVRSRLSLRINTPTTVTTAGGLNPTKASCPGTKPNAVHASNAATATTSWRQRPYKNRAMVRPNTPRASQAVFSIKICLNDHARLILYYKYGYEPIVSFIKHGQV